MNKSTFTVFCQQTDQPSTIHIDTVEATDLNSAIEIGRQQCLDDWNGSTNESEASFTIKNIHCLGVAEGDVTILHWADQQD